MEAEQSQADLLEVVRALRLAGRLPRALNGGQEKADERGDDRDHHEQFDEREARRPSLGDAPAIGRLLGHRRGCANDRSTVRLFVDRRVGAVIAWLMSHRELERVIVERVDRCREIVMHGMVLLGSKDRRSRRRRKDPRAGESFTTSW